jgi:hypothetical protein
VSDLRLQVAADKETVLELQHKPAVPNPRAHAYHMGTFQALASQSHGTARDIALQLDTHQR